MAPVARMVAPVVGEEGVPNAERVEDVDEVEGAGEGRGPLKVEAERELAVRFRPLRMVRRRQQYILLGVLVDEAPPCPDVPDRIVLSSGSYATVIETTR